MEKQSMTNQCNEIRVSVVLHAGLRKYGGGEQESTIVLPAGATLGDLIEKIGMAEEDVWVIGLNGQLARREATRGDGNPVEFWEPVAGG